MPRRLLSAGACLLAGYHVASCRAASALHRLSSHIRLSRPSSTPPLCPRRLVVVSHLVTPHLPLDVPPAHVLPIAALAPPFLLVLQHVRLRAGSRVASCGTFALNPPARPLAPPFSSHPLLAPRPVINFGVQNQVVGLWKSLSKASVQKARNSAHRRDKLRRKVERHD